MIQKTDSQTEQRILNAFTGPKNRWRSVWGVARETQVPTDDVLQFVEQHRELFEQSPIAPSGIALFGLKTDIQR